MKNNLRLTPEFIENVNKQLLDIERNSKETETIDKVQALRTYVKNHYEKIDVDRETLIKNIEMSLKESRKNNSDMETTLYIIHGDLVNSRISVEKARALYEQYLSVELFEQSKL